MRVVLTVDKTKNFEKIQKELVDMNFKIQKVGKSIGVIIGEVDESKTIRSIKGVEDIGGFRLNYEP